MIEFIDIVLAGVGGVVGALVTRILIYKIIHPYIVLPRLKKRLIK